MKRSEMINKLSKWLDRSQSTVLMNGNVGKAKSLLEQLEIWGMLPPTIRYDSVNEFQNIKDTDILHDYDVSFAWEDEEED
jgi:hypothetical protein